MATVTLTQALALSCNTAFAKIGLDLGDDALREQAEAFGFNRAAGAFRCRSSQSIYPADLDAPQTAQSAIGQYDVRATAMQMAMVGAGVANDGVVMKPYLVAEEQAPDLSALSITEPEPLSRAVSSEVARELTRHDGRRSSPTAPGQPQQSPESASRGKTGTAQDGNRPPHVWFMAFAPADDPQVAVAVIVENGGRLRR